MLAACSACAGDYEDPERTAWVTDGGEVEDVGATRTEKEEFPAESQRAGQEATMRNTRKRLEKRSVVWGTRPMKGRPATAGRRRQRDVLCDVMLSASQCETWLTLEELAKLTHYPPASISAQLRHLRKQQFGGYEVEKRKRLSGRILHGEDFGTVSEYGLQRGVRRIRPERGQANQRSAKAMTLEAA